MSTVIRLCRPGGALEIQRATDGHVGANHPTFFASARASEVRIVAARASGEPPYTLWIKSCAIDLRSEREARNVAEHLGISLPPRMQADA